MQKNQIIKKTVIIVGYACNNRCQFCIDSNKRDLVNKTTEQIKAEMVDVRERGRTYLEFIGGEMTIRPEQLLRELGETEFIRRHQCPVRSLAAFENTLDQFRKAIESTPANIGIRHVPHSL